MEFAKAFDANPRTASLPVLLNAAKRDGRLIPRAASTDLSTISSKLQQANATLVTLKKLRNQRLAHVDANPEPLSPLMSQKIESLAEDVKSAFNRLSAAHDGSIIGWDVPLRESDRHTTDVLRIVREEMDRKQQQYEEEMVRIGLDELRRMEMTMGRRLDDEELQSVKKQFGLTEEQMQRIHAEALSPERARDA